MTAIGVTRTPWTLLPIGIATGILSGLLGVGGGVVIVPALVWMGYVRHMANAISLATIFVIALSGMIGFAAASAVEVLIGLGLGMGGVAGATGGARWASKLSGVALARIFGVLLLLTGLQMLLVGSPAEGLAGLGYPVDLIVAFVIGAAAGVVSGLAGVGGGVIMVPAMIFLLGLDQHTAEGTSLLAILFTAAAGTRVNVANSYVDWRAAGLVAVGGVVAAPLAATFAQQIPAGTLGRIFALWLLLIAMRTLLQSRSAAERNAVPKNGPS